MSRTRRAAPRNAAAQQALLELAGDQLGMAVLFYHSAVAARLGLTATDLMCVLMLRRLGPLTAGALADRTGLTTGAITGVIDRLEKAKLARRVADPRDRRRVVVEPRSSPARDREIRQFYEPAERAMTALASGYSESDVAKVIDFLTKASTVLDVETRKLRSPGRSARAR